MNRSMLLSCLLVALCLIRAEAQTFEGEIEYHRTSQADEHLKKTTESRAEENITVYIRNNHSRIERFGPAHENNVVLVDGDKNELILLLQLFGKKIALVSSLSDAGSISGWESPDICAKPEYKYSGEKKVIAGIECKKCEMSCATEGGIEKTTIWYCSEIPNLSFDFPGLEGMPMEYTQRVNGVQTLFEAVMVEKRQIDESLLSIPADYKITTREELMGNFPILGE